MRTQNLTENNTNKGVAILLEKDGGRGGGAKDFFATPVKENSLYTCQRSKVMLTIRNMLKIIKFNFVKVHVKCETHLNIFHFLFLQSRNYQSK